MDRTIRLMITMILSLALCAVILTGCRKVEEPVAAKPEEAKERQEEQKEDIVYEDDEEYEEYEEDADYEDFDEYEEDADFEDYAGYEEDPDYEEFEEAEEKQKDTNVKEPEPKKADAAGAGKLTNEKIVELAKKRSGAPIAELDQVMDNGNLYIHLYEDMGDHTATIDWYEIDPKTLKGKDFMGNDIDLSGEAQSEGEGDEGEGVRIADGEYVTDEEYEGELSKDGKTLTITTALSEFVNSPSPSYPKQTYVITVADSCKCVEIHEETIESSFFDKMDLISDFLKGVSGLPITLKFKNNELVEILFSS